MHYTGEIGTPLRTKFGEHRRAVIGNDADQPFARHFNTIAITVFRIWRFDPSFPYLESTIAAKDIQIYAPHGQTWHIHPIALMVVFPMLKTLYVFV